MENARQHQVNRYNQQREDARNERLVKATAKGSQTVASEISKLKDENAKLVAEINLINQSIKKNYVPKWQFWTTCGIASAGIVASILVAIFV